MTSTTMMATLDVLTPTDATPQFSSELIAQSGQSTSSTPNSDSNGNSNPTRNTQIVATRANNNNNTQNSTNSSYYGISINAMYGMLSSCLGTPFWSGSSSNKSQKKNSGGTGEIPIGAIKNLQYVDSGSQAAVFSGEYNGKIVAVKKVKDLEEVKSVKNLLHLKHDNIIKFIGLCVCTQTQFYGIVMEFCERGTLSSVLHSAKAIPRDDWIRWLKQIAQGMLYLHENKVIHRDLKSPNILIADDNDIKICDFGTSQVRQDMKSMVMSFCGTVSWMAPEVIRKKNCCAKVDVYSFGVVLWEMLTREKPYKNIEQMSIMFGVGRKSLTLPVPTHSTEGAQILLKQALSDNPSNRPSFRNIVTHIGIIEQELKSFDEKTWQEKHSKMRREAEAHEYPKDLDRENLQDNEENDLVRRRREALNDAEDIRRTYENKLQRLNEVMETFNQIQEWAQHVQQREKEVEKREEALTQNLYASQLNELSSKALVARVGPRGRRQDVSTYVINSPSSYGHNGYDSWSSTEETNDSVNDFSRQSSYRSSTGRTRTDRDYACAIAGNRDARAYSEQQHVDHLVRGSTDRNSGCSVDSGVNINFKSLSNASSSHFLSRNVDGRSSDSTLAAKRRSKDSNLEKFPLPTHSSIHQFRETSRRHSSARRPKRVERESASMNDLVRPVQQMHDKNQNDEPAPICHHMNDKKADVYLKQMETNDCTDNGNTLDYPTTCRSELPEPRRKLSNDEHNDESSILTNSNTSAMASSLERALQTADGLSDKEKNVKAASAFIRGHRRCVSNPVNSYIHEEYETSSDSEDEVDV